MSGPNLTCATMPMADLIPNSATKPGRTILNTGKPSDPVLLWRSSDPPVQPAEGDDEEPGLILPDGWHRLAVYRMAQWSDTIAVSSRPEIVGPRC